MVWRAGFWCGVLAQEVLIDGCCGYGRHNSPERLSTCRRPCAALCLPGFDHFVTSMAAGIAARPGRPLPGQDLHLLEQRAFARHTWTTTPLQQTTAKNSPPVLYSPRIQLSASGKELAEAEQSLAVIPLGKGL